MNEPHTFPTRSSNIQIQLLVPHFIFAIIEKQWNVYLWNDISSSNVDVYIHIDHIHNYCVRRIFRFAPTFFLKPSEKCVLLGSKNNKVLEFAFRLFVSGIISNKNVQNISQPHCFVSYGISSPYKFTCKNCVYIYFFSKEHKASILAICNNC